MITTEEIAVRVYQMLQESEVKTMISGVIDYERNDYTKEDVIIVPHTIAGEDDVRFGQINVNIHVPDLPKRVNGKTVFRTHFKRLIEIRSKAIEVLQTTMNTVPGITGPWGLSIHLSRNRNTMSILFPLLWSLQ